MSREHPKKNMLELYLIALIRVRLFECYRDQARPHFVYKKPDQLFECVTEPFK